MMANAGTTAVYVTCRGLIRHEPPHLTRAYRPIHQTIGRRGIARRAHCTHLMVTIDSRPTAIHRAIFMEGVGVACQLPISGA